MRDSLKTSDQSALNLWIVSALVLVLRRMGIQGKDDAFVSAFEQLTNEQLSKSSLQDYVRRTQQQIDLDRCPGISNIQAYIDSYPLNNVPAPAIKSRSNAEIIEEFLSTMGKTPPKK